jgi:precorrin-6B methylase 2
MTGADPLAPIDWAARWRALVAGRDEQRGGDRRDGDATRDPWGGRADRFAAYSAELPADDPTMALLREEVRPGDTILDVGAGAGRYALPLARLARRVIAVEPSPAMRRHLEARIAAEGAGNVEVVAGSWPEAAVEGADVTLCAHVVYGVREIAPFLRALDRATRRRCLIVIRVDQHPGLLELSAALFGATYVRQPALLDLYNALADLGIAADVRISAATNSFRFADHEAAADHYRDRLRIPPGGLDETRLRAILAARLVRGDDGRWSWPGGPPRNAIVNWGKG